MSSPMHHRVLLTSVLTLFMLSGCSGDQSAPSVPAGPDDSPSPPAPQTPEATWAPEDVPAEVLDADFNPGQGMLAMNRLVLDPAKQTAELEPLRTGQIGESYAVDIYDFLRKSPCGNCLQVNGLAYTGSEVEVEFVARHPFQFLLRYDLHVFDVRLSAVPLGWPTRVTGITSEMGGNPVAATGAFDLLTNADGYSSFFTEVIKPAIGDTVPPSSGTIHGYKLMFKDLGPSNYDPVDGTFNPLQFPSGHNAMAMGEDFPDPGTLFRFAVPPDGSQLQFALVLDCAYGASARRSTRLTPKYFLPEFHAKPAFEVQMEITGDQLIAGSTGEIATANVTVRDWQGETSANPGFNENAAPSSIAHLSGANEMVFAVPGVIPGTVTQSRGSDYTGAINAGEYWTTYETTFPFTNTMLADEGRYYAVVAVRDDMYNSENNLAYTPKIPTDPTSPLLTDIATYAIAPVDVFPLTVDCPGPLGPTFNAPVVFPPADGTFNIGKTWNFVVNNIVRGSTTPLDKLQMDFDWDGVPGNFAANAEVNIVGAEPAFAAISTDLSALGPLSGPVTGHRVGFRVTDTEGNCNYDDALIDLWPEVTCPGGFGPSFSVFTDSPRPQFQPMTFTISSVTLNGQTPLAQARLNFSAPYNSYQNILTNPPAAPFTILESFTDPVFGTFTSNQNITVTVTLTDQEGNCNSQNVNVVVQPPAGPDFDLTSTPFPATVRHGVSITFTASNYTFPSGTLQGVDCDPDWDGVPANFVNDGAIVYNPINGTSGFFTFDYRRTAFLPAANPYRFAVRVRSTTGTSTIKFISVTLNTNQAPTIQLIGLAGTATTGTPYTIGVANVNAGDPDGTVSPTNYRIDWGDGTIEDPISLPRSHTWATTGNKTVWVYARDDGYGPNTSPAPQPARRETGTSIVVNVTSSCACTGFWWCENFECTTPGTIPTGWVYSNGNSTQSRFGVKTGIAWLGGQNQALEESGRGGSGGDAPYDVNNNTPNAVRWGVFSPPITIPAGTQNYLLTVSHRSYYSYLDDLFGAIVTADGARIYVKSAAGATDPGTAETSVATLVPTSGGPSVPFTVPYFTGIFACEAIRTGGHPFASIAPALPTSPNAFFSQLSGGERNWTSTYNLNAYRGMTIRLYFVHGQTKWNTACSLPRAWNLDYPTSYGWKIDQVQITQT